MQDAVGDLGRDGLRSSIGWGVSWWHVVHAGALVMVLALSPSTYGRSVRAALARHVYLGTAPMLPWKLRAWLPVVRVARKVKKRLRKG